VPSSADSAALGFDPVALGLDSGLADAGINLAGVLSVRDYDARVPAGWQTRHLLPSAGSVVVLATGGRAFFRAFRRSADPGCDAFLVRVIEQVIRREGRATAGYYFEDRGGFADFVELARVAGLGSPSRLGILIHPEYGPWLAIRALLFTERELDPTSPDPSFAPCDGCPAPCASACPGQALPATGFDLERCTATTRREDACRVGCAARHACVLGQNHRYDADAEAHHRVAALAHLSME
jgi:epoxyqueuosine reductase